MTYEFSKMPEPRPCSEIEGAFQRALCEEMESMRAAIIENLMQANPFFQAISSPEWLAKAEKRAAEKRAAQVEKWGERRVNARGIGLRIARTYKGRRLTTLPEEEVDPW